MKKIDSTILPRVKDNICLTNTLLLARRLHTILTEHGGLGISSLEIFCRNWN